MGANVFYTRATGKNADDAFWTAVGEANSAYGYEGYTGTIAEKCEFVEIRLPDGEAQANGGSESEISSWGMPIQIR